MKLYFQLQYEGVVGTSYHGDYAIDDIVITPGACQALIDVTLSCNFMTGLCFFQQSRDDDFDWEIKDHGINLLHGDIRGRREVAHAAVINNVLQTNAKYLFADATGKVRSSMV